MQWVISIILFAIIIITLYPVIYVFSMSISDAFSVARKEIWFFPKGFSLDAYNLILDKPDIWKAYYNTLWYTVVGTFINVTLTILIAYPLSRKHFFLKNKIMFFIAFTMWFSGGLVPLFILVSKLGIYNTRWAMVLPNAAAVWNIIITRTFFQTTIPEELPESAKIDGANDITILTRIVIPTSMAIIAVNVLFYAVGHWNSFFNALLYLPNKELQPLQILLRKILLENQTDVMNDSLDKVLTGEKLKYAIIIFAMLPIMMIYPFLQKYFVKGVMIGSIKG